MKIVASSDIGVFGPINGKPVICNFTPFYHIQGIIPWFFLPFVFVAFKENRKKQAAWILAPIALSGIIYLLVMDVLKMTSGTTVQFNVMFTTIVVGFSLILLFAERISSRYRLVTFLLAVLIYFGFLGINLLSNGFSKDIISISYLTITSIPPIIFASIIAGLNLSKPFSKARFIIYPAAALFTSQLIIISTIMLLLYSIPIKSRISEALFFSFISSLIYLVGLLPFLVLLFKNPFWRKRFESLMGMRSNILFEPPPTNNLDIPQNQI